MHITGSTYGIKIVQLLENQWWLCLLNLSSPVFCFRCIKFCKHFIKIKHKVINFLNLKRVHEFTFSKVPQKTK